VITILFLFFSTTEIVGQLLVNLQNVVLTLNSFGQIVETTTMNVFAETKTGRSNRVIVFGSHLDSVPAGPGINDNGSGSATNLAIALLLSQLNYSPVNKIRFAWWGAEELGLLGSQYYVNNLFENNITEYKNIALNLNFDMLGSPNYHLGIYNASSGNVVRQDIVNGSLMIQELFETYFQIRNVSYMLVPFVGRSDYGPFIELGIPAGGTATGADDVKTDEERSIFGGYSLTTSDPCYHQSCDTVANINTFALDTMAHAAAYVLGELASDAGLVDMIYFSNNRSASIEEFSKFDYHEKKNR